VRVGARDVAREEAWPGETVGRERALVPLAWRAHADGEPLGPGWRRVRGHAAGSGQDVGAQRRSPLSRAGSLCKKAGCTRGGAAGRRPAWRGVGLEKHCLGEATVGAEVRGTRGAHTLVHGNAGRRESLEEKAQARDAEPLAER
jgi:hypothetical protein